MAWISGLSSSFIFRWFATLLLLGLALLLCSDALYIRSSSRNYRLRTFHPPNSKTAGMEARKNACLIYLDTSSFGQPWNSMPYNQATHEHFRPSLFDVLPEQRNGGLHYQIRSKDSQKYLSVCRDSGSAEIRLRALHAQIINRETRCQTWFEIEDIPQCIVDKNGACSEREFGERYKNDLLKYVQIKPVGFHNKCLYVKIEIHVSHTQDCPKVTIEDCTVFDLAKLRHNRTRNDYDTMPDVIDLNEIRL